MIPENDKSGFAREKGTEKLKAGLAVLFLGSFLQCAWGLSATTAVADFSSAYFLGPAYVYSLRAGSYDFEDLQKSQAAERNDLSMVGLVAGRRFPLAKHLRLQVDAAFDAGSATDDTLRLSKPTSVSYTFYHFGIDPEFQLLVAAAGNAKPFLLAGAGLNYMYVEERTFFLNNDQEVIWIDLPPYVRSGRVSVDFMGGFGFDIPVSGGATFSIAYSFRYWQPVGYDVLLDFPLTPQKYHETFFSHKATLTLLFGLR